MSLGPALRTTLHEIGYEQPTPIQAALIPEALKGIDLIGQAQTGTGKTAAFLIPILERLEPACEPQALILVPTRELVVQVKEEARRLAGDSGARIAAIYGGQDLRGQMRELEAGVQIVVGTPGRIIDMIQRGKLQLSGLRTVVLDEADRMLDIGFRPDIERILRRTPSQRQTLLLSATMPPPVLRLTTRYMHNPQQIMLSADELSVDKIKQKYFTVDADRKLGLLLRLLVREKPRQCLIFCQMKVGVHRLAAELGQRIRGVMAMSGDLPQSTRNRVMQNFRDGKIRVLVATDVVGRGIDVQGISHVINFDIPEDPEAYVHRIGRTGRMGKDGTAFTLVTPEQGYLLTGVERFIGKQIMPDQIEGYAAFSQRSKPIEVGGPSGDPDRPRMGPKGRPIVSSRYRRAL